MTFRTIEAVMYTAGVVSLLSVLTLGQRLATAPATDRAPIQGGAMADSLLAVRDHASVVAVSAFSVGALMYYAVFYRSRLVPRWLSGWGAVAALLMIAACLLALFSNADVTGYTLLVLPMGVQEMVLAVWLLTKGFSPVPLPPATSSDGRTAACRAEHPFLAAQQGVGDPGIRPRGARRHVGVQRANRRLGRGRHRELPANNDTTPIRRRGAVPPVNVAVGPATKTRTTPTISGATTAAPLALPQPGQLVRRPHLQHPRVDQGPGAGGKPAAGYSLSLAAMLSGIGS